MLPDNAIDEVKEEDHKNSVDRRKISDESVEKITSAIKSIDNDDTKDALKEIAHIITGNNKFE